MKQYISYVKWLHKAVVISAGIAIYCVQLPAQANGCTANRTNTALPSTGNVYACSYATTQGSATCNTSYNKSDTTCTNGGKSYTLWGYCSWDTAGGFCAPPSFLSKYTQL